MGGPLEGIRVVDMGHAGVGPYAGSIMGQLGAEVVKIEPPWGDIIQQSGGGGKAGMTTFYIGLNMNKRGIILDLKQPQDKEIYYKLVARSDVYMDNWRDDAAGRIGIGYDDLAKIRPDIVYVNSSGFGARGPLRVLGSYDNYGEVFSGVTSITGDPGTRGERARGGVRVDTQTSLCLVEMILAGLWRRQMTGKGQKIQGSQMESALQLSTMRAIEQLNFGITPRPTGNAHPQMAPSQAYKASDRYIAVSAQNEQEWRGFCLALGRQDLIFHPDFSSNAQRMEHRDALNAIVEPVFLTHTAQDWTQTFQTRRVPAGPFMTQAEQIQDPHIMGAGLLQHIDTCWGEMILPPIPLRFSATPTTMVKGPKPGQDTAEVLAELGYGQEYVREWVGPAGVMAAAAAGRGGRS